MEKNLDSEKMMLFEKFTKANLEMVDSSQPEKIWRKFEISLKRGNSNFENLFLFLRG